MNFSQIEIPAAVIEFFSKHREHMRDVENGNAFIEKTCGMGDFFESTEQLAQCKAVISKRESRVEEPDRREYGDFQTNRNLALESVRYILSKRGQRDCDLLIEPSCGTGNFILAALCELPTLRRIIGLEIYKPYVWETKFKILAHLLQYERWIEIEILHANAFDFDFEKLSQETRHLKTGVIGNPPWVTNAELGTMDSDNLPPKSNFKKHSGLDAMTGKGNFDIGEYITLTMLRNFSTHSGYFGFLIKNSVVKNLVFDQRRNRFRIGRMEKLNIDAKKEFNTSVDACLFLSALNREPELSCRELDFYTGREQTVFGWTGDHFVYAIADYKRAKDIEGKSPFTWRQGIKHDCAKVMELESCNGHFKNGLNRKLEIEPDLVYGLLKSADLKEREAGSYRKRTIITQRKIGQETSYIKRDYPLTYRYLKSNKHYFDKRKSIIYKGKPEFSIFGVGDYSFMPYKVAISGLYKSTHFTLVRPENDKPIMLDDTCYFIGFADLKQAQIALYLLNHKRTQQFLQSIVFPDSKRPITKEVLMRIDLEKCHRSSDYRLLQREWGIKRVSWEAFGKRLISKVEIEQAASP